MVELTLRGLRKGTAGGTQAGRPRCPWPQERGGSTGPTKSPPKPPARARSHRQHVHPRGFNCQRQALAFLTLKQRTTVFLPLYGHTLLAANGTHKTQAAWHWAFSAFHFIEVQFAWIRRTEA